MNDRFSRQSFLGVDSEALFRSVRVGVAGLGGGGSHIAQQLAHVGIGHFALFDPDTMEFPNLNRTVSATFEDAISNTPKVIVAERAMADPIRVAKRFRIVPSLRCRIRVPRRFQQACAA